MDKPNKGRTITIKIDGKKRPIKNKQEPTIERKREQPQSSVTEQVDLEAAAAQGTSIRWRRF